MVLGCGQQLVAQARCICNDKDLTRDGSVISSSKRCLKILFSILFKAFRQGSQKPVSTLVFLYMVTVFPAYKGLLAQQDTLATINSIA